MKAKCFEELIEENNKEELYNKKALENNLSNPNNLIPYENKAHMALISSINSNLNVK